LLASLLAAAAIAWLLTRERMLGMDAGPGTDPGGVGFYVVSWVVMMAAMMFPSIAPMVLTFAFIQRQRRARGALERSVSRWMFIAGYLVTWTAFGLAAYGVFVGVRSLSIPAFSWHRGGPYLAGAVLIAAAVYQLTPAKDACLSRCRGTLGFLMAQWREGPRGALRMGIVHGAWCVGCCWALMASLFALGLMSLTWMIVIAALIAVEKLLPIKALASHTVASVLVILGLGVALAPSDVPALTLPGSPAAVHAMQAMGMHGAGMTSSQAHGVGAMGTHSGHMSGSMPGMGTHTSHGTRGGPGSPMHSSSTPTSPMHDMGSSAAAGMPGSGH
jgi:predicted metal-binding membrane protein